MATTWTINTLESHISDGGVFVVHYNVDLVDGGESAGAYGSVGFTPDPTDTGFIAYADLTEADAVGWVKADLGAEAVTNIEAALTAQVTLKKTPVDQQGKPWA